MKTQEPASSQAAKNRTATRRITTVGVVVAIAVLLSYIPGFPIIPVVSFIRYEYSDLPLLIAALALGAPTGLLAAFLSVGIGFLLGVEGGAHWGALLHFIAIGTNVAAAGLIYRFHRTKKGAIIGLLVGVALMTLAMIPSNLLITPLYTGTSVEVVKGLLLPGIIPVNLLKGLISAVLTFIIYKRVSKFIH
jgi:riboflavin transporter FmnP